MLIAPAVVHWNASPFIFTIGSFGIRWYSVLFVVGFIIGYYIFAHFFKRENLPTSKLMDPLLYTLVIATLVGARLGHCIFYDPGYYFGSWSGFLEVFMPWKGGLASHGGAIALLLAMWRFSHHYGREYGFDFLWIMDRLVIPVCFAGACIRLGNLFNSEIYGNVTDLPWGFIYERNGETLPKHPTQLYEAISYTILGLILILLYEKKLDKLKRGTIFGVFLVALFGVRFLIEFIKEPQEAFEESMALNMGQLLSIPFIVAGVVLLVWSIQKGKSAMLQPEKKNSKAPATNYAKGKYN